MVVILASILATAAALLLFYILTTWKYDYWKKKKVLHIKTTPFFGNYKDYITLKKNIGCVVQDICKQFPNEPYIGAYYGTEPALIVQDPELIKLIMTKDFIYFNGREVSKYTDRETNTRNMFFTYGDRWKVLRQNTSHLFTLAKIRNMFPLIEQCARDFGDLLRREVTASESVEARSVLSRYTMDCFGTCAFGVETSTMGEDIRSNPFKKIGDLIFESSNVRGWALISRSIWPSVFYGLGLKVFPDSIANFFNVLVTGVFEKRAYKPTTRQDFVDLLLNLRQQEYLTCESLDLSKRGEPVKLKVDTELLVAQCVLFFAAGFETSSTTSSSTLFELAKNQEAQRRAAEEVDEYLRKRGGRVEYDCVTELPYLEACIEEAMRMYPVFGLLTREVMERYTLPDGLVLDKGVRIHLPIYHLHHSAQYFPEPYSYRPERFLPENKTAIRPYTYMPFGEGQRICVGARVAKTMMMPGLITILRDYRVELADGMPRQLKLDPRAIVTQSRKGIRLKLIPRNKH